MQVMAREFGDRRAAQWLAAGCLAVSSVALAVGHLLSTATFDVLVWTVLSWLIIRLLKDPGRSWLPVGVVAGVGLEIETLVVFLLVAVFVGLRLRPFTAVTTRMPSGDLLLPAPTPLPLWVSHGHSSGSGSRRFDVLQQSPTQPAYTTTSTGK